MGGLNVKNTMIERVLQIIAPHPCLGCGKVGAILCINCKYDIIHEPFLGCILCGAPQRYGICESHESFITRAYTVGQRQGALRAVINKLKFERTKAASLSLAQLFDESLPSLPSDLVVVPIPTLQTHVRQRGYDQVDLIARQFTAMRGHIICRDLRRVTKSVQHTAAKEKRLTQAQDAFKLISTDSIKGRTVLLVDDIVTTGATLQAAAAILAKAGATVWVATLAYQPLD